MKRIILLIAVLLIFSCGKDKVVLLPEIAHTEVTEIFDVSPAYLFYDATQKDSVELNRKNLIVTTNWLVNVDKRLTLRQAVPHIKFIQEKKRNSSHKNEKAKNYYTCNDTSRKNLGFIEFTDVVYIEEASSDYFRKKSNLKSSEPAIGINFDLNNSITILNPASKSLVVHTNKNDFISDLKTLEHDVKTAYLSFNGALSFQEYIGFKTWLKTIANDTLHILNEEFIY